VIALQYGRFGEPTDVVNLVERETPDPGDDEVRLRILRSPIHNHDLATIRGVYGVKPKLPATPGSEAVGIADAIGSSVTQLRKGQRIAVVVAGGVWAQYAIASAYSCVPIPDQMSDESACQVLAMPLSAVVLLDELCVKPGDWIVQTAAGGAVGRALMKLAQAQGVQVVSLVRREETAAELRNIGAQHVVVTEGKDWPQRVLAITGGPVARIVDSVCDDGSIALEHLLETHGEYVVFGALAAHALRLDPGRLIFKELRVRGFWLSEWLTRATESQRADVVRRSILHTLAGDIVLPVAATFPLKRAAEALRAAEQRGRTGKILFAP
jgi:NADPH2:quinone reductase